MTLHILQEAAEDIIIAHDWYEARRKGLGSDFELCIEEAFNRIISIPEAFSEFYPHIRCAMLTRFPYGIFYTIKNSNAYIIGVFHLKRKPSTIKRKIRIRKIKPA